MRLVRFWEWDFEDFIVVSVASIIVAVLITLNVSVGAQDEPVFVIGAENAIETICTLPDLTPCKEGGFVRWNNETMAGGFERVEQPPGHCPICGTEGVHWYLQTTIVHEPLLVYSCPRDGNLFTEVATESE